MKPSTSDILTALNAEMGSLATSGYANSSAVEDVYEGFIWWQVITVAQSLGWSVTLQNVAGSSLLLRCGPGNIYSSTPFSYARLVLAGHDTLEVHLGIAISGRSGVSHEFDVVVVTESGANDARTAYRDPTWEDVRVHVECKVFQSKLSLGLGRAMWGLSADCRLRLKGGLVTNAPKTDSISSLLGKHGNFYGHGVVPGATNLALLRTDLRKRFERWM